MTLSLAIALFLAATLGADAALQAKSEKKAKADVHGMIVPLRFVI